MNRAMLLPNVPVDPNVKKFNDMTMKVGTSLRDVTVTLKDGRVETFTDINICDTQGSFIVLFSDKENVITRFPVVDVAKVVENLKP